MTIWYVTREGRNPGTVITSASQRHQPGYNDEALDDETNPELQAYLAAAAVIPIVSVKMWQAKAALALVGKLEAANAAVAAANNPALSIAWEYASDLSRSSPGLAAMAQAIGLNEADVDALFVAANAIVV